MKKILKSALRYLGYEFRALPKPERYSRFEEPELRDYEALKRFTLRAAQFCASSEEANVVRKFYLAGFRGDQMRGSYSRIEIGDQRTSRIGVWQREAPGEEARFVRDSNKRSEWFYWADHQHLEPKRTRSRVVLLGESVARGYFYDPHFNVAEVLQAVLERELGPGSIDVVDLAKTNLRMPELKTLIGQSLALCPDVLVVFAGNNWNPNLSDADIPYVESVLQQDGVPGLKACLDEKRRLAVRSLTTQAHALLAPRNIKIIWVIPDTNLMDWKDPPCQAPLLPGDGNVRWRDLHRLITQVLASGDGATAENLAEQMHALDHGTSAVPLRVLADSACARGDGAAARKYLELCRGAVGWDPTFSYTPRVFTSIQEALREAAALSGNRVVDLPETFDTYLDGELPGRRLFLDYCHMAADGINVAASEIARETLSILTGKQVPRLKPLAGVPSPTAKVEGKASLVAAAHNAAYYQNVDIVRYWCDRALDHWPECAPLIARFADYATRDTPIVMCKSGRELFDRDELGTTRYLLHGRERRLDLAFGDAAVASLGRVGIDIKDAITQLRIEEHSPRSGAKELSDFFYSAPIPAIQEHGWTSRAFPTNHGSHAIYASAFWETSSFVFFAEKEQDIAITFTFRVRSVSDMRASVGVAVNGSRISDLAAERNWCRRTISIPRERIVEGLNEISISWPDGDVPAQELLNETANSLLSMRLPYFYRVFGEVHSLTIHDPSLPV